jgi:hypothetical protein
MPFVFISERGAPFSRRGFQAKLGRAGEAADRDYLVPHTLSLRVEGGSQRFVSGVRLAESISHHCLSPAAVRSNRDLPSIKIGQACQGLVAVETR